MKLSQGEIDALFARQGQAEGASKVAVPEVSAPEVPAPEVAVPASFPSLVEREAPPVQPDRAVRESAGSLGIFGAVELDVTVRLGQTQRSIGDLMKLGTGAVLELDRLAGETVDILVNGRLLAKGEVVVIGENFGVRVAELVHHAEGKSA